MKRSLARCAAALAVAVVSTAGLTGVANAGVSESGGCATEFVRYFSINPFDPKPQVSYTAPATVTVNADGTFMYVDDDKNDVLYFAGCLA